MARTLSVSSVYCRFYYARGTGDLSSLLVVGKLLDE